MPDREADLKKSMKNRKDFGKVLIQEIRSLHTGQADVDTVTRIGAQCHAALKDTLDKLGIGNIEIPKPVTFFDRLSLTMMVRASVTVELPEHLRIVFDDTVVTPMWDTGVEE